MSFRFNTMLQGITGTNRFERIKFCFLAFSFFLIIGSYTVIRILKDTFFISIVGREYWPQAKLWSIFMLIPAVLIFSKLTDILRRHHLIYFYSIVYGVGGLVIAYFLSDPVIGLLNTDVGKHRLFGWIIYFFIEGYNPFVVSLFWAFCHTVTTPEAAKSQYPLLVAASKVGGMITAGSACLYLSSGGVLQPLASDVTQLQCVLVCMSLLLLCVPIVVFYLISVVPNTYLHGYTAAYRVEIAREKAQHVEQQKEIAQMHRLHRLIDRMRTIKSWISHELWSMSSGLFTLLRYPYLLGIFGMIFFWEVISVFVNYERLAAAHELSLSAKTCYLLNQDFLVHMVGFVITIFGTRAIVELLGERKSLVLIPIATGSLLMMYFMVQSRAVLIIVYVLIRSINYAFSSPLRESLYIPTTKEMKFKSKSWIDSFGTKIAKGCGSLYGDFVTKIPFEMVFTANSIFFGGVILLWLFAAHLLGRRYEVAVARNEVIGAE